MKFKLSKHTTDRPLKLLGTAFNVTPVLNRMSFSTTQQPKRTSPYPRILRMYGGELLPCSCASLTRAESLRQMLGPEWRTAWPVESADPRLRKTTQQGRKHQKHEWPVTSGTSQRSGVEALGFWRKQSVFRRGMIALVLLSIRISRSPSRYQMNLPHDASRLVLSCRIMKSLPSLLAESPRVPIIDASSSPWGRRRWRARVCRRRHL